MNKDDRRVRHTRQAIRKAFSDLLLQKPINRITVKELCDLADINRGTFYEHYVDIYALLDEFENEYADKIISINNAMYTSPDSFDRVLLMLAKELKSDPILCIIAFDSVGMGRFEQKIHSAISERLISSWKQRGKLKEDELQWVLGYILSGSSAIFREWYRSGFKADTGRLLTVTKNVVLGGLDRIVLPSEP